MAKKREDINFSDKYIKWFSELARDDIKIAGGKGANLGEMYTRKFPVPPGFVVTADAFAFFISDIRENIKNIMLKIDFEDTEDLEKKSKEIRKLIEKQEVSDELKMEILESYHILGTEKIDEKGISQDALNILRNSHEPIFVSVRSSATTEDLADASFAGQQQSFLNIKGDTDLIEFIKKCFSSLYTARSMYYRNKKGFSEESALLAVVVQKMIDSEKSGVVFSKNPVNIKEEVVVEAVFGLGEGIVSGMINPDNYVVSGKSRDDLKIEDIKVSNKKIAIVRSGSGENKVVKLSPERSKDQVLTKGEILEIANYALKLEEHYSKPQDIEFAIEENKIYIVQSRPITTKGVGEKGQLSGKVILEGLGASPGIGVGNVKLIKGMEDLSRIKKGDILVTEMTNPDMVVSMQKSVAIVTDEGGITSHASIVSREMGIPAIVGTGEATKILKEGMKVTVDGTNGKIYEGQVAQTRFAEVKEALKTKVKLKLILDLPEFAERAAESKIKFIGLLRLEGIIASMGKHPLNYEKEKNLGDYAELLRKGIEKISKNFKSVWIRASDLRSDEYSSLEGSPEKEGNPMLGLHGIRFSLKHPKILEAELEAIRKTAENNEDKEFGVMFPQIISVNEILEAKKIFNKFKLRNMKFGVMIETPAAVQIIDDIAREVEFISFGTNDLTQYTLAVDRGDDSVQDLYNESHPAVLSQIKKVLDSCRGRVETSICGQAGSNKEMVKFLLENEIDSISVNADAAYDISIFIREIEERLSQEISKKKQEVESGFDKRKQQGMICKEEIHKEELNENAQEIIKPKTVKLEKAMYKSEPERVMRVDNKEVYAGETGEIKKEERKTKEKKIGVCDKCGKEFRLRFRPKKGLPIYCKSCYKHRNAIIPEAKKETEQIAKIDSKEHIKDEIKYIQEELEQVKQQKLDKEKQIEQSIETETSESSESFEEESKDEKISEGEPQVYNNPKAEIEGIGDDFNMDSIGVYNPDESKVNPEEYNYNADEKNEFSDVF